MDIDNYIFSDGETECTYSDEAVLTLSHEGWQYVDCEQGSVYVCNEIELSGSDVYAMALHFGLIDRVNEYDNA